MGTPNTHPKKRRVATVGTFDGLHRGHQRVISTVKEIALERDMEPMVVCFDRHPLETIAPEKAPGLIQCPSERTNALYREGFNLLTLEFTHELASMTAKEWLARMHEDYGVDVLVVGYDNTFGSDGTRMNLSDYIQLGKEIGIEVVKAPYEPHAASSAIRHLLEDGNLEKAIDLLGHPYSIKGTVEGGKHMGESLGFPTANISPSYRALMPKRGVYAVETTLPDGTIRKGVANIGRQPTVADNEPVRLEVHIPGYDGILYGERLKVKFIRRLRDEQKFETIGDLQRQIRLDIKEALES